MFRPQKINTFNDSSHKRCKRDSDLNRVWSVPNKTDALKHVQPVFPDLTDRAGQIILRRRRVTHHEQGDGVALRLPR